MSPNVILFGWNRSVPGREKAAAALFGEFVQYLDGLRQQGAIQNFDTVFLDSHGGDLNGFFLIRADTAKLNALAATAEWITYITRAAMNLQNTGVIRGVTGDEVMKRMALWTSVIPS